MQRPAEDNRQPCQAAHQPDNARRETQRLVFIFENEQFAEIYFLMGNDLETSEALYSAMFCITSKERFLLAKIQNLHRSHKICVLFSRKHGFKTQNICSFKNEDVSLYPN